MATHYGGRAGRRVGLEARPTPLGKAGVRAPSRASPQPDRARAEGPWQHTTAAVPAAESGWKPDPPRWERLGFGRRAEPRLNPTGRVLRVHGNTLRRPCRPPSRAGSPTHPAGKGWGSGAEPSLASTRPGAC